MTSYNYQPNSLIKQIILKKADNGSARAYLCANEKATQENLEDIARRIINAGWYAIPSIVDGKPALEIRGYFLESSVIDLAKKNNWTQGSPKIEKEKAKQTSFTDKLRSRSLQLSSIGFLAADAGYITYGHKEGRLEDVLAGASYMVGSATMGLLGTQAQATAEIRNQTKKLFRV